MSYFREIPDILYQSNLLHKTSSQEYIRIKNIFRRVKIQDWIAENTNFFNRYTIRDGDRPDTVAERLYGSADRDWIVILTAGITNIKDDWPLSNADLYRYGQSKYGLEDLFKPHHYETIEVRDYRGRLILPAGQRVDKNFTIYDSTSAEAYVGVNPLSNNVLFNESSFGTTPNNGTIWSKYLIDTATNSPIEKAFDGKTETTGSTTANTGMTFSPPTPIPFAEKIEIYVNDINAGQQKYITTISEQQQSHINISGSGEWKTIYTGSGTFDGLQISLGPSNTGETVFLSAVKIDGYVMRDNNIGPVTTVSNYEYETQLNESKREIEVMKPIYLQQFLNDMRELMNYKESSQTINSKLLTTENTRLIGP